MTHREAIDKLIQNSPLYSYDPIQLNRWYEAGKIPILYIPYVAHRIGCKPSDLSKFFARPLINLTGEQDD